MIQASRQSCVTCIPVIWKFSAHKVRGSLSVRERRRRNRGLSLLHSSQLSSVKNQENILGAIFTMVQRLEKEHLLILLTLKSSLSFQSVVLIPCIAYVVQWWKEMHNELGLQLKWSSTSWGGAGISKEHSFIDATIRVFTFSADNLPILSASTNKMHDNDA